MNFRRKIIYIFSAICMMASFAQPSFAKVPVDYDNFVVDGQTRRLAIADIDINGENLNMSTVGAVPVIIDSRTFVPISVLAQKLGYSVKWIQSENKALIENGNRKIELWIGQNMARVDNNLAKLPETTRPVAINARTYVPISFVSEKMDLSLDYDPAQKKARLYSKSKPNSELSGILFGEGAKSPVSPIKPEPPSKPEVIKPISPDVLFGDGKKKENITENQIIKPVQIEKQQTITNSEEIKQTKPADLDVLNIEERPDSNIRISARDRDIDFGYFFLNDPRRLVIDVKNSELSEQKSPQMTFESKDFVDMNSTYHYDGNYTRFTIKLPEDAKNESYRIVKDGKNIDIRKLNIVDAGDYLKYKFDRKHGSISVNTKQAYSAVNISDSPESSIVLKIPKSATELKKGDINIAANRLVKSMKIEDDELNVILHINLADRVSYQVKSTGSASTVISLVKKDRDVPVIVIDPGHGGHDSGAVNSSVGITEKKLNLQVGLKLRDKLKQAGYVVYMSRDDDSFVPLNDIASGANSHDPDIFISIHHNSAGASAKGLETYYYISEDSKKLAKIVYEHVLKSSGQVARGYKSMPFVVVKKTTSPAILVELGFITNAQEVKNIMSDSYQNMEVNAIVEAVNEYFGKKPDNIQNPDIQKDI